MALAPRVFVFALPWLQGFFLAATVDEGANRVEADLTDAPGNEIVEASFSEGITVRDAEGHVLAKAPGFEPSGGSADDIDGLAIGDAQIGTPVLVLAATTGGHNESVTWLTIYRVANSGELQPVFTGEVERHAGRTTKTGTVTVVPGGIIYQGPRGDRSIWLYDESVGRYVQRDQDRPSA
jgi:hypothetical protein